jgi:hypothetical protein
MNKKSLFKIGEEFKWSACEVTIEDWTDKLEELYSDEGVIYVTDKVYHYDDTEDGGDLKFDYKYCIKGTDMRQTGDDQYEDRYMFYELGIIPTADSLCEEVRQKIAGSCGCCEEYDIVEYSYFIRFYSDEDEELTMEEDIDYMVNAIANLIPICETFFGFSMDRPFNCIGTSGWDKIREAVNGTDFIKASFSRAKSHEIDKNH